MIGQKELMTRFDGDIPKTVLLLGAEGSGRRTFAKWIADTHKIDAVLINSSVDDVREMIEVAYNSVEPTLYIIPNVEQMSGNAQNALLKILEEPPKSAYFVMTATQENLVLSTIVSRSQVYYMDAYKDAEISEYYRTRYSHTYDREIESYLLDFCTTPGEVDLFLSQDVVQFVEYVQLVFDRIARVSGANSFKIGGKINLSDDNSKYNLVLFWRAFMSLCFKHFNDNPQKYSHGIRATAEALKNLRARGANKQMAFDMWVLEIRKGWIDADG